MKSGFSAWTRNVLLTIAGLLASLALYCPDARGAAPAGRGQTPGPPPEARRIEGPQAEPEYYFWDAPFTMRNRNILQADGSTRHVLVLRSSTGGTPETAPEVYYVVEELRRPMRRGRGPARAGSAAYPKTHKAEPRLERGGWVVETSVGIQSRLSLHAKIRESGKLYYASITLPVWGRADNSYVPPDESGMPADWPCLRAHSPSGEFFDRTDLPLVVTFEKKLHASDGALMLADSLRTEKIWLAFADGRNTADRQSMLFVPQDDPLLNRSPKYTKHLTWVARLEEGGSVSLTAEMNRNWQTHSDRDAGFLTAGAGFGGALAMALFMRRRFREPHRRFRKNHNAH